MDNIKLTTLPPAEELYYKNWIQRNNIPESDDYDMRGFFKGIMTGDSRATSAINPNDGRMHFPDTWKLPNHPKFSTDSLYYNPKTMPNTPSWSGGEIGTKQGKKAGAESWSLRRPSGDVVVYESPFYNKDFLDN